MRASDHKGIAGKAWLIPPPPSDSPPAWAATLSSWIVNVPGVHAFWSWWQMGLVHLRDIQGTPPAYRRYPEAEYEIQIFAFDPETPPDPDNRGKDGARMLTPPDLIEQFNGITDEQAKQLHEGMVRLILDGRASPDQDYRSFWREIIHNTVKHMALGGHPTEVA